MNTKITVKTEEKKLRLDKFLTEELVDLTRSQVKKLILSGNVFVNGDVATVHKFLKNNDKIEIESQESETTNSDGRPKVEDKSLFKEIKIIEENKDFTIIEKPAGLLTHPTDKEETNTLVDWIMEKYPDIRQVGEDPARPAIVHRLDKDVSGLMLIPKNQAAYDFFKQQFKLRTIDKKYTALVHGEIEKDYDEIDLPISRSKTKDGLFAAHPKVRGDKLTDKDKEAITEFEVEERFTNFTLLKIKILTGRTHQIRVHMLSHGHPIVGDKLYFNRKLKSKKEIGRIFLYADSLSFTGLDNKKYKFESPLPDKLADFLKSLKKK